MTGGGIFWKKYVADGFKEDCEEILKRCKQVKKLSFEKFCDVWKDMEFVCVFYGRRSGAELAEFSEECLYIAKPYMLKNTNTFEESVAGLFLVYALINLQPFNGFASLRVINEDVPQIQRLEQVARAQRRLDVLYILGSVLIKGPTQYHVAVRERGLEYPIRKYLNDDYIEECVGRPKGVLYKHSENTDLFQELVLVNEKYRKAKMKVNSIKDTIQKLQYTNDEITGYLKTTFEAVVLGVPTSSNDANAEKPDLSLTPKRTRNVSSIKERAMKSAVSPMKHLTGIKQRQKRNKSRKSASTSFESETNSTSPRKKVVTPRKKRKVGKIVKKSESSDSDISLNSDDYTERPTSLKARIGKDVYDDNINDLSIQVGSLPIIISAPEDKEFEIEIIDKKACKMIHTGKKYVKNKRNVKVKDTAREKRRKLFEHSPDKLEDTTENSSKIKMNTKGKRKLKTYNNTKNNEGSSKKVNISTDKDSNIEKDRNDVEDNNGSSSSKDGHSIKPNDSNNVDKDRKSKNKGGASSSINEDTNKNISDSKKKIIEPLQNIFGRKLVTKQEKRDMKKNAVASRLHRLGLSEIVDCAKET